MSWGSGACLLEDVLGLVEKHIPKKQRKKVVKKMAALFEELDADVFGYECTSPTLQELRLEKYGPECKCGCGAFLKEEDCYGEEDEE